MKRVLSIILIFLTVISRAQSSERLIGYTVEGWGRSNVYPFLMSYFVMDSIALSYHGTHGSYFDTRRLQFLPAGDQSVPVYSDQSFYSDIPAVNTDLAPLPDRFFFSWNSIEYDTLRAFQRDSMFLPFSPYTVMSKQYDPSERIIAAQFTPVHTKWPWANKNNWSYNTSGRLAAMQVCTNYPGPGLDTLWPQVFVYNPVGQLIMDSTTYNSFPSKNLYHYTPDGYIDTITNLYSRNGIWNPSIRHIFTYKVDASDGILRSYLLQMESTPGTLVDRHIEYYTYLAGSNKLAGIRTLENIGGGTSLTQINDENRHYNVAGLPDTVFFSDYNNFGHCKVLVYDTAGNPVTITMYDSPNWVTPKYWEKGWQQHFYYQTRPAPILTIIKNATEAAFLLSPNPTHGPLSIRCPFDGTLSILDIQGKAVLKCSVLKGQQTLYLPSLLSPGIYTGIYQSMDGQRSKAVKIMFQP